MPDDTGEFMLGDVYVTVVLMESNDQVSVINDNSETWTASAIADVKTKVQEGLQWWTSALGKVTDRHTLHYEIDFQYADQPVLTQFEPIINSSAKFSDWIYDFLGVVGYRRTGSFSSDIRAFNNAQRQSHGTDWAFTIFVVNDEHDTDGTFAPGGFDKAFAFAGGRFFVMPAGRPPSTVAHETGHMFWALDEYRNGGTYASSRGYYNTQNWNAWDNPAFRDVNSGQTQQSSIMASGGNPGDLLYQAYVSNTSSQSSLEMIGWKDSDGDGVFDVLDVPLTLSGSGYFDESRLIYRFRGTSAVQTLPNHNPSGFQNDISLNQVSRAEYRVDGGTWQTAAILGASVTDFDLSIPLPVTVQQIEIRTIDATTGITSPVFIGTRRHASTTGESGIQGFVFGDEDGDSVWDSSERGLPGVTVQLVDASGDLLPLRTEVEPDNFPTDAAPLNNAVPGVSLSAIGTGVIDLSVVALPGPGVTTGEHVFGNTSREPDCQGSCVRWTQSTRQLRLDFQQPVANLSLDAVADSDSDIARLEVYDSDDRLLGRYTTQPLAAGNREAMTIVRHFADIAYAIAHGHANSTVLFDSLEFGPTPSAVTDTFGAFDLPNLADGRYVVHVQRGPSQSVTSPIGGVHVVSVTHESPLVAVDFGLVAIRNPWQNSRNELDVNDDGSLTPIDALQVINMLNQSGARPLTSADSVPPYVDTSGDSQLSPGDVLLVINALNREGRAGLASYLGSAPSEGEAAAEGESVVCTRKRISNAGTEMTGVVHDLHHGSVLPWARCQRALDRNRLTNEKHLIDTCLAGDLFASDLFPMLTRHAANQSGV